MVLAMSSLVITGAGSLTLVGTRPVILAVYGDAYIAGVVLANSRTAAPARIGAGADRVGCGAQAGGNGSLANSSGGGASSW